MAAEYFLYNTTYGNTIVDRSSTSFAPIPPYGEIYIEYFIPQTQPLYFYRETGGTIVINTQGNIDNYLNQTELPPTADGNVTYGEFTGTTAILSASTSNLEITKVNLSGDTMTGTLSTSSNFFAIGAVTGSSLYGSVWIHSPIISGSSCIQAPITCGKTCSIAPITIGTTCVCSPRILGSISVCSPIVSGSTCVTGTISCATTRMQSPIVCGGTCVSAPITCGTSCVQTALLCSTGQVKGTILTGSTCSTSPITCGTTCVISPITIGTSCVCSPVMLASTRICSPVILGSTSVSSPVLSASTCLCSIGTARLVGATTAASTLNVSGVTKLGSTLCLVATPTTAVGGDYTMFWNPTTKQITAKLTSGGSTNYYYRERTTTATTTSATPQKYLGFTGTSMPVGIYQIDFTQQVGQAASNSTVYGRFQINGATQGSDFLLKMNQAGFTFTNTLSRDINLTATTNCFDMYVWAGGGTACATFASLRIKRI